METPYNEEQNITNKNINYLSYTEKMLEIINNIRKDPVSYADIIEDSMQNNDAETFNVSLKGGIITSKRKKKTKDKLTKK